MKKLLLFTTLTLIPLVGLANLNFHIVNDTSNPLMLSHVNNVHGHLKFRRQGKLGKNSVVIIPAGDSNDFAATHSHGGQITINIRLTPLNSKHTPPCRLYIENDGIHVPKHTSGHKNCSLRFKYKHHNLTENPLIRIKKK